MQAITVFKLLKLELCCEYSDSWVNGAMDNGSKLFISSKCCLLDRNKFVSRIVNLHG